MCIKVSAVRPYQCWHWAGGEIVQEPIISAPGSNTSHYEIAHRELDAIDAKTKAKPEPWAPAEQAEPREAAEDRDPRSKWISPWEPRRPSTALFPAPPGKRR